MKLIHVAYGAVFFNALPILAVLLAAVASSGFSHTESGTILFAASLSDGVNVYLKLLLGTIVVPLFTAFALQKLDPNVKLPREASTLLVVFALLALLGVILGSAYPVFMRQGLAHALDRAQDTQKFKDVPWDCAKENLTFVCLVLGIRLPKG